MRLRLQTFSPLPELKAWFIPEIQDVQETVFTLKELVCQGIPQLRANQIHAQDLVFLLDGFELLNDSPISVVRDGDLIIVKRTKDMSYGLPSQSRKRKRNDSYSSSSSSSVSSEASSSTESPPSDFPVNNIVKSPQLEKRQPVREPLKQSPKKINIPPGQGKASTHSRNKRRKKKREYEKLGDACPLAGLLAPLKGVSEANKLSLGPTRTQNITNTSLAPRSVHLPQSSNKTTIASSSTHNTTTSVPSEHNLVEQDSSAPSKYVYITPEQVMMGSLRNKNKKKGFKGSMKGPVIRKITFSDGIGQEQLGVSDPASNDVSQNVADHQILETAEPLRRLIPPSELQDSCQLPPNVFVTSVDVEEHIWDSYDSPRKKKRKCRRGNNDDDEYRVEEGWERGRDQACNAELSSYGDGAQAEGEASVTSNDLVWNKAEKIWETLTPIQSIQHLTEGVVLGWKELAINPQTFTPEMLLFLVRVTKVTADGTIADFRIHFRQLRRAAVAEAAIAFGVAVDNERADGSDMESEECVTWSDVLKRQWKIVDV